VEEWGGGSGSLGGGQGGQVAGGEGRVDGEGRVTCVGVGKRGKGEGQESGGDWGCGGGKLAGVVRGGEFEGSS
jgi:hypothetical protein